MSVFSARLPWKGPMIVPTIFVFAAALWGELSGQGYDLAAWWLVAWPLAVFTALVLLSPPLYFVVAKHARTCVWKAYAILGAAATLLVARAVASNAIGWLIAVLVSQVRHSTAEFTDVEWQEVHV